MVEKYSGDSMKQYKDGRGLNRDGQTQAEAHGMTEEEFKAHLNKERWELDREWLDAAQEQERIDWENWRSRAEQEQERLDALIMHEDEEVGELEKWSEKHFGELAFWRTIAAGLNIALSTIVIAKLFGWI